MKRLFIFLITSTLLFTLGGCSVSEGPLEKANSTWYAESNGYEKLFFETQGPNAKYGFGYLVIKGVKTSEMFVEFDERNKTMTYYPIHNVHNKYPEPFISFKIERLPDHWLFQFKKASDKAKLIANENNTGDTFFDELIINRDVIDSSPIDVRNFKGIKWVNEENKITISDFKYNTTRAFKGEKNEGLLNKVSFIFHFKDNLRFEIYNNEGVLVAGGTYSSGIERLELSFEFNDIFPGLTDLHLEAKKL